MSNAMKAGLWISFVTVAATLGGEGLGGEYDYVVTVPRLQVVNSMLLAPNGKALATLRGVDTSWNQVGQALTLEVWSLPQGEPLWTGRGGVSRLLGFSPDSTHLLTVSSDGSVVLSDSATGKVRSRLRPKNGSHDSGMLFGVAVFDPDGRMLMTAANKYDGGSGQPDSGVLSLWEAKNGRFLRELKALTNVVEALAISADGKTLAVAHHLPISADQLFPGCALSLVDLETDSVCGVLRFRSGVSRIFSVAFSENDEKVAAAGAGASPDWKGEVGLWDVASGRGEQSLSNMGVYSVQPESHVAFSPDGNTLAIAGNNTTVLLWDVPESKWRSSLSASEPPAPGHYAMRFVNGGLLLGRVNDFQQVEVTLWDYPGRTAM
jgi:WD40 repeat protein